SSDVCSSDLEISYLGGREVRLAKVRALEGGGFRDASPLSVEEREEAGVEESSVAAASAELVAPDEALVDHALAGHAMVPPLTRLSGVRSWVVPRSGQQPTRRCGG